MKILLISNLYEPYARGGAEQVVKTVAEGLVQRGHDVTVLTAGPMRYGFLPRHEQMGKVRVLRFSPWNFYFVRNDWMFPKFVRAAARLWEMVSPHPGLVLRQVIKKEKPDVVMTHNLVGLGMRIPAVIKKSGVRHIHTLHDVQLIHPSGLLFYGKEKLAEASLVWKWYEQTMRWMWDSPDVVVSPSKWLLDLHTSRGFFPKSKTSVLPNPVDCGQRQQSTATLPTTSHLPPNERAQSGACSEIAERGREATSEAKLLPTRLLYAGQLELHKGIHWLLNYVSRRRLPETCSSMVLEIAGSGSLEHEIKKAALRDPEHIIFHGKLDQQKLYERFAAVHALVVPSLCYENTPRIISEALCVGLPVIASNLGGIPEMIRDGQNGFLFEPGNTIDFERAWSQLPFRPKSTVGLMTVANYLDKLLGLV